MSENEFEDNLQKNTMVGNLMFQTNLRLLNAVVEQKNATLQQTAVLKILTVTVDAVKNVFGELVKKIATGMEGFVKDMHAVIEGIHTKYGPQAGGAIPGAKKPGIWDTELLAKFNIDASIFKLALEVMKESVSGFIKKMSNTKLGKAVKGFTGMFNTMMKASLQSWAMEQLMKLIEPFMMLLEPIAVIFDILNALLQVMIGEALGPFYDAMQPIYDVLLLLIPQFEFMGIIIGILIQMSLIPLTIIFELLYLVLEPFLPLIEPWLPVLRQVSGMVKALTSQFRNLSGMLETVRQAAADFWDTLDDLNPFTSNPTSSSSGGHGSDDPVWYNPTTWFQRGGSLQQDGLFYGHRGEEVVSGPSAYMDSANIERMMEAMEYLAKKKSEKTVWG